MQIEINNGMELQNSFGIMKNIKYSGLAQAIIMNHSELRMFSSGSNFVMDIANLIQNFYISLHPPHHPASICDQYTCHISGLEKKCRFLALCRIVDIVFFSAGPME